MFVENIYYLINDILTDVPLFKDLTIAAQNCINCIRDITALLAKPDARR